LLNATDRLRCQSALPGTAELAAEIGPDQIAETAPRSLAKSLGQRDRHHLRFVAQQPCLLCGRDPCDPYHLKFAQDRGGRKGSRGSATGFCITGCEAYRQNAIEAVLRRIDMAGNGSELEDEAAY
jgi:hypothetical protein